MASLFTLDGISFDVDPDNVAVSVNNFISVQRSLAGSAFVTYANTNTPGASRTVQVSGAILSTGSATAVVGLGSRKAPVTMSGVEGVDGEYIVNSISINPQKPRMQLPGDALEGDIQYSYNISLTSVSEEA